MHDCILQVDDLIPHIVHCSPDTVVCSFLLVSMRTRKLALAECKSRSTLPHLWDLPWETLVMKMHKYDQLSVIMHTDYCLCAYIGHVHQSAVVIHATCDLIGLAHRDDHEMDQFGIYARDVNGMGPYMFSSDPYFLEFRAAIVKGDVAALRKIGVIRLGTTQIDSLAIWLAKNKNVEIYNLLENMYPELGDRVKHEINKIGLRHNVDGYPQPNNYTYLWTKHDVHTALATSNFYAFICKDDPKLIPKSLTLRQLGMITKIARNSLCCAILNALGEPSLPHVSELPRINMKHTLLIASIRSISPEQLCKFAADLKRKKHILQVVPGCRELLIKAHRAQIDSHLAEVADLENFV